MSFQEAHSGCLPPFGFRASLAGASHSIFPPTALSSLPTWLPSISATLGSPGSSEMFRYPVLTSALLVESLRTEVRPPLWPRPPPYSPPSGCQRDWVELSVSHSKSLWVIYFTCGNVHISMLLSQFIPSPPSHTVFTSLFSVSIAALKISSMGCLFLVALLSEG